eukprot:Sdes_comp20967_c0_seq1m18903
MINQPKLFPGFLFRDSSHHHSLHQTITHTHAGTSGAHAHDSMIGKVLSSLADGSEGAKHAGQSNGACALDVIVEGAEFVLVAIEKRLCIVGFKVLKLDHSLGPFQINRGHKLVHQVKIRLPLQPPMAQSQIERILKKRLVVGAHVNHHGEAFEGVDAASSYIQRELPDGDRHSVRPQIAQAEDAAAVGDHDDIDIIVGGVSEDCVELAKVCVGEVDSAGFSVQNGGVLAGVSHCGGVDDGGHFFEVFGEEAVEADFVSVLQSDQEQMLGNNVFFAALSAVALACLSSSMVGIVDSFHLLLDGKHSRGEEATDA